MTYKEIDSVMKNLTIKKNISLKKNFDSGFTDEFKQTFKGELMLIFLKFFQNSEKEEIHPRSFYESNTDTKSRQVWHKKKKLQASITDNRCKHPE